MFKLKQRFHKEATKQYRRNVRNNNKRATKVEQTGF